MLYLSENKFVHGKKHILDLLIVILSPPVFVPDSLQSIRALRAFRIFKLTRLSKVGKGLKFVRLSLKINKHKKK